ncbi:MAG: hypothetical protein V8R30_03055 [Clostridia bacterium]
MKKRILIGVLIAILIVILSFIIPVKIEKKEVWYSKDLTSYGHNESFYYNIYGIKIWPFISENEHIRE